MAHTVAAAVTSRARWLSALRRAFRRRAHTGHLELVDQVRHPGAPTSRQRRRGKSGPARKTRPSFLGDRKEGAVSLVMLLWTLASPPDSLEERVREPEFVTL